MADLNISIKNEAKIAKAFKKFPAEMGRIIADTLRASTVFIVGKTKEHIAMGTDMWKAPLDTGAMRRGIHPIFSGMKAFIKPSSITPYAQFVHEGTQFMRARPFFEVTASREQDTVGKFARAMIEKAISKILP